MTKQVLEYKIKKKIIVHQLKSAINRTDHCRVVAAMIR